MTLANSAGAAFELLLNGDLTGDEYKAVKMQCELKISLLGTKMAALQFSTAAIDKDVPEALHLLLRLDLFYQSLPLLQKREMIESLYFIPMTFTKDHFHDLRLKPSAYAMFIESSLQQEETMQGVHLLLAKLGELCVDILIANRPKNDFTF